MYKKCFNSRFIKEFYFLGLIKGFSQHVFKTFIVEHPILNFIITPITFVVIIYFAKQYCHFVPSL
jgi:hypothetical protein